mmetsp:Transcript_792/g.1461  ORF Transcript_792/g.1461 Transcript_792/m.1461 type:complete len:215 (+) Transcript_792:315-959(+)
MGVLFRRKEVGSCPVIINQTKTTIVVFLERGTFFNKQVLLSGEAMSMTKEEMGGPLPYRVHAVVGDERSLPTKKQSLQNLAAVAAIPTAFCAAVLVTAVSAGTLTGPAMALSPMVSGMVVQGVVIDSAAILAGTLVAARAATVSEMLIKKHPENFIFKSKPQLSGHRIFSIQGGMNDGPIKMCTIKERDYKRLAIENHKSPMRKDTNTSRSLQL